MEDAIFNGGRDYRFSNTDFIRPTTYLQHDLILPNLLSANQFNV